MNSKNQKKSGFHGKAHKKGQVERKPDEDDLSIIKYEKLLKLNKKKGATFAKELRNDGFDYILEVVDDPYKVQHHLLEEDVKDLREKRKKRDTEDQPEEVHRKRRKFVVETVDKVEAAEKSPSIDTKQKKSDPLTSSEDDGDDANEEYDDDELLSSDEESDAGEEEKRESESGTESDADASASAEGQSREKVGATQRGKRVRFEEDIYGRLRDNKGNVMPQTKAYVPPAKRRELPAALTTKLKGLVNRVAEQNLEPITNQIQGLFSRYSRGDVCEGLSKVLLSSCISHAPIPPRLVQEQCLLVALLHNKIGTSVGACFLQDLIEKFDQLLHSDSYGDGKEMDNLLSILCNLLNFSVIHSGLMYDIMEKFVVNFNERDMELILVILKNSGATLRKGSPAGLKAFIHSVQNKAASIVSEESRVRFLLETITNIKNNNFRKIPGYDPEHIEHLRKLLKNYAKGSGNADPELNMSLQDLMESKAKGKWWLVGSAWSGQADSETSRENKQKEKTVFSGQLVELARKQRMSTGVRKNIFCTIMSSEDINDAFEKCLQLNLNPVQEREIIAILIHLCLNERNFNPFYAYLIQKFCVYHRRFMMTFQFTLWDHFKDLAKLKRISRKNLAEMLQYLVSSSTVGLKVLKAANFVELEEHMKLFLREFLTALLVNNDDDLIKTIFMQLSGKSKLEHLREGLAIFLKHFILEKDEGDQLHKKSFRRRIQLVLNLPGYNET